MHVLVVGGTGPTGPHVVAGLLERGHEVTIFHRGTHERPELAALEHIHGDPHFAESIADCLGGREFGVVLAMYGRVQLLAPALASRCGQFVSIGGTPVYAGFFPRRDAPGLPIPVTEEHATVDDDLGDPALRFSRRLAQAEQAVFEHHPDGTVLRFPMIYGPGNARANEFSVYRRVRDGRKRMVLPDGGLQVHTRCAARNAAAAVVAAVDAPAAAAGQVFNCGDAASWSLRQWTELIVELMDAELELVGIPSDIAVEASTTLLPLANTTAAHVVVSTDKALRLLGYQPVIRPVDALAELLAWFGANPDFDPSSNPAFTDRFDYAAEDALIDAYGGAAAGLADAVPQQAMSAVHSMPHPSAPGQVDDRGR